MLGYSNQKLPPNMTEFIPPVAASDNFNKRSGKCSCWVWMPGLCGVSSTHHLPDRLACEGSEYSLLFIIPFARFFRELVYS